LEHFLLYLLNFFKNGGNSSLKNNKGFTLIKILVVVAIITILAAIAVPQYAKYRKRAQDSAALSDLKTIQTEAEAYYSDHSAYPH